MKNDDTEICVQKLAELFTARAEAVAARVRRVADIASAERLIAEEKRVGGAKALSFCLRTFVIAYAVSMLFCTALRIFLALC